MPKRIVIAGGGYVGLYTALRLRQRLREGEAEVVVVSPDNFMTYRPLLPEVASGTLEPRHAVVPLRAVLRGTRFVSGKVVSADREGKTVVVRPAAGPVWELDYDELVIGMGAVAKLAPVPGLAENGIGFNSLAEGVHLRDHVLRQLEIASATPDPELRRCALTFVFVGGGYTGVEAIAELQDMATDVLAGYPELEAADMRWILVEALDRILTTVSDDLADLAADELTRRGIDIRTGTRLDSAEEGVLALSDGTKLSASTLVWVAGTRPRSVVAELGLPVDDGGRLVVDAAMRVERAEHVWAAGDCAAVPDPERDGVCPPTAQHAVRQGEQLADNLVAVVRGGRPSPFRYRSKGEFITLGKNKAVAEVFGRKLAGSLAWAARRGYYATQIPTWNRKVRVLGDWLVGMPFGHDVVDFGSREAPRGAFEEAARKPARSSTQG
ncbi:NADH dehydrogenase [Prauserella marina]|uniref:NADH dehydrogenase n=1 Tax=Prauserella marina TaxID=530584 RepID=A0A222VL35_9PSEU|nr:NAD(P)/FAD-dependent oxidoreductase [Prauserella marina]ASR34604.1 NADH dehydrogenase [Prauserella marina]PWV85762.1 NADH dehydrogenase FAD-containing subunit [Prauserella marina]SDC46213.1 NADH dehydrogenase [Prauserella marina]